MQTDSQYLSFLSGEALANYRRVKLSAGTAVYADATDTHVGVTNGEVAATDTIISVRMHNGPGTFEITAAGAITANATVYAAADGKIASSGTIAIGTAKNAATADGDIVEVIPNAAFESLNSVLAGSSDGLGIRRTARATFDATAGKAIGSHGLSVTLPDNAIIVGGVIDVETTFTSATDAATIAVTTNSAGDIRAATAISTGTSWDAGRQAIIPKSNTPESTGVKLTAAREVTVTVAVEALTAGKFAVFLDYYIGL